MAGGGDVILIPELDYDIDYIVDYLEERARRKKTYSIVVVAEGIKHSSKNKSAAQFVASQIQKRTNLETRETILGYIQRGGSPSPADRILATRYGAYAAELISKEQYGLMVKKEGDVISSIPLNEVGGKLRKVSQDHPIIKKALGLGICLGTPSNNGL